MGRTARLSGLAEWDPWTHGHARGPLGSGAFVIAISEIVAAGSAALLTGTPVALDVR